MAMIQICRAKGCVSEVVQGSALCQTCFTKLPEDLRRAIIHGRKLSLAAEAIAVSKANNWLLQNP
jgi:hypothetical protein